MLDLLGGIGGTDYPAGLQLGSLFQISGPTSCCPADEGGSCPVRLTAGTPSAGKPIAGTLVVVPVKDQLGRAAQRFAAFLADDAAPLERQLVGTVLRAAALALSQSVEVVVSFISACRTTWDIDGDVGAVGAVGSVAKP